VFLTACVIATVGCCSGGEASGDPRPTPTKPPVTVDLVLSRLPVPELCEHKAGELINGTLPWSDPGLGFVAIRGHPKREELEKAIHLGDLTGDGANDALVEVHCSAGGVGWGAKLLAYTTTSAGAVQLIDMFDTTTLELRNARASRPGIEFVTFLGARRAKVRVMVQMPSDAECCPHLPVDVTLVLRGSALEVADTHAYREVGLVQLLLDSGPEYTSPFNDPIRLGLIKDSAVLDDLRAAAQRSLSPVVDRCTDRSEARKQASPHVVDTLVAAGSTTFCGVQDARASAPAFFVGLRATGADAFMLVAVQAI
jgi:hypothetical protein